MPENKPYKSGELSFTYADDPVENILHKDYDNFTPEGVDHIVKMYNNMEFNPELYSKEAQLIVYELFKRVKDKHDKFVPDNIEPKEVKKLTFQELNERYGHLDPNDIDMSSIDLQKAYPVSTKIELENLSNYKDNAEKIKNYNYDELPDKAFTIDNSALIDSEKEPITEEDKSLARNRTSAMLEIQKNMGDKSFYNNMNDWMNRKLQNPAFQSSFMNLMYFTEGAVDEMLLGRASQIFGQDKLPEPSTNSEKASQIIGHYAGMLGPLMMSGKIGSHLISGGKALANPLLNFMAKTPAFQKFTELALKNPKTAYISGSVLNNSFRMGTTFGIHGQAYKHPEGTTLYDRVKELPHSYKAGFQFALAGGLGKIGASTGWKPAEISGKIAEFPALAYMGFNSVECDINDPKCMTEKIAHAMMFPTLHGIGLYKKGFISEVDAIKEIEQLSKQMLDQRGAAEIIRAYKEAFDELTPEQKEDHKWQVKKVRELQLKEGFDVPSEKPFDVKVEQERLRIEELEGKGDPTGELKAKAEAEKIEGEKATKQAEQDKIKLEEKKTAEEKSKLDSDISTGRIDPVTGKDRISLAWSSKKNLSILEKQGKDRGLSAFDLWDNGKNYVSIDMIHVPEKNRGKGLARESMEELINYADMSGKTLTLTPTSEFGANKTKLTNFYKDLGFVMNKGRNKDFLSTNTMIRYPKENRPIDFIYKFIRKGATFDNEHGTETTIALDKLNPLGYNRLRGGSVRDVYDLGDGKVIKIAKTPRGLEQNNSYKWADKQILGDNVPELFEVGYDYIVVENVPRNTKAINEFLKPLKEFNPTDFRRGNSELIETMEKMGLGEFRNYDLLWNDFIAERNWGMRKDGTPVLIDEGALNKNVHSQSKVADWAKSDWADILLKKRVAKKEWIASASEIDLIKEGVHSLSRSIPSGLSIEEVGKFINKKTGEKITPEELEANRKKKGFKEEDFTPISEYIEQKGDAKAIMSELWDRAKSSGKRGVEDFKNLAKELDKNNNLTDNITKEFFNDIEKELRIEKIQETIEDYTEKGLKDKTDPIKPTKTESSKVGDFVGNILKTKLPNDAGEAKAVQVIIENLFAGKEFEKLKGTRGWDEIIKKGSAPAFLTRLVTKVANGDYTPSRLHLAEDVKGLNHLMMDAVELIALSTDPKLQKSAEAWGEQVLGANVSYRSELGRGMNALKMDISKADRQMIARAMNNASSNRTVRRMLGELLENPENLKNDSWRWKFVEFARNAKLASTSSLSRSVVGNTVSHLLHVGDMATAPLWNKALVRISNQYMGTNYTQSISALEPLLYFAGVKKGIKPALKMAWEIMQENDGAIKENAYLNNEGFGVRHIKGLKGKIIRAPQNAQGAIDVIHRLPAIHGQIYRYGLRGAKEHFHKIGEKPTKEELMKKANEFIENPTPEILKKAYEDAEFITFQSKPTDIASQKLSEMRRKHAGWQFAIPFQNTPTNLPKQMFYHRNAIGGLHQGFKIAKKILDKTTSQENINDASLALARATTGTAATIALSSLVYKIFNGEVTSDGSDMTEEQRRLARNEYGWEPNSVKLKDSDGIDNYVSFQGYEPISGWLSLGRGFEENKDNPSWMKRWIKSNVAMLKAFQDLPTISQFGDLVKVMDDKKDFQDFVVNLSVGALFPSIVRQTDKIINKNYKERVKRPRGMDFSDALLDKELWARKFAKEIPFSNQLPWLANKNITKKDLFGRNVLYTDPAGSMFGFKSTIFNKNVSKEQTGKKTKMYDELEKLFWAGDRDVLRMPNFLGDVNLDPYVYDEIISIAGPAIEEGFSTIINNTSYWNNNLSNKARSDTLLNFKYAVHKKIRERVLSKEGAIDEEIQKARWRLSGEPVMSRKERYEYGEGLKED